MSSPTVVIVATDEVRRFEPVHDGFLLRFGSKSLLQRQVEMLRSHGCQQFVIVVSSSLTRDHAEEIFTGLDAVVRVVLAPQAVGIAAALKHAEAALSHVAAGPIYVVFARDIVDSSFHAKVLRAWDTRSGQTDGILGATRSHLAAPRTYLEITGARVLSLTHRTPRAGQGIASLGGLAFSSSRELCETIAEEIDKGDSTSPYEDGLRRLMHWHRFAACFYDGDWVCLRNAWHFLDVMHFFLHLWETHSESPGPEFEAWGNGVWVAESATIEDGARIEPPALIGEHSHVGRGALIRGSIIGHGSRVGVGSVVIDSYLDEDVELLGCSVQSSFVGRGSSIGRGSVVLTRSGVDGEIASQEIVGWTGTGPILRGALIGDEARIGEENRISAAVRIHAGATTDPGLSITADVGGTPVPDHGAPAPSFVTAPETEGRSDRASRRPLDPR